MTRRRGCRRRGPKGAYGLYLVDSFRQSRIDLPRSGDRLPQPHPAAAAPAAAGDSRPVRPGRGGSTGRGHGGHRGRVSQPPTLARGHTHQGAARLPDPAARGRVGGRGAQHRPADSARKRLGEPGPRRAGRGARRGGRQRLFHRARPQGTVFPGAGRTGPGRHLDAFGHAISTRRTSDLHRMPRAEVRATGQRVRSPRWPCAGHRRV